MARWFNDTDRRIFALAFPALGALVAEPLYILADTAVVGRLGTPELGGLALASSLLLIGYSAFIFLAYGTTSTVARLLGAGQHERAAHQAVQSLWLALLIGIVVAAVTHVARMPLISLLAGGDDANAEVVANAEIYLRVSLLGVPAMLLGLAGVGYLRGLQDTRRPLYVAVATAVFNLVLEVVLIFGFGFGIGASALSTVIAQWLSAAAFMWWIRQAVSAHGVGLAPDWRIVGQLAGAGADLLVRTTALRAGLMVTLAVAARLGATELAAHEIAFQIWNFLALALDAVAIAAQAMIGQALGAGDPGEARRLGDRIVRWGLIAGAVFAVVVLAVSPLLGSVFSNDDAVIALAGFVMLHVALWQPVNGVVFALDGILIGAGDLRFLAISMAIASAVLIGGAMAALWLDAGIGWLWAALGAWMITRAALLLRRYRGDAWLVVGAPG